MTSDTIMQQVQNETVTEFWSHQLQDHMMFLRLGLVDEELKQTAYVLEQNWNDFRNSDRNDFELKALLNQTRTFQNVVHDAIVTPNNWIGYILASFVEHINDELNYFERKLNPTPIPPLEEMMFWRKHHATELGVTQQLIDPREEKTIFDVNHLKQQFQMYQRDGNTDLVNSSFYRGYFIICRRMPNGTVLPEDFKPLFIPPS